MSNESKDAVFQLLCIESPCLGRTTPQDDGMRKQNPFSSTTITPHHLMWLPVILYSPYWTQDVVPRGAGKLIEQQIKDDVLFFLLSVFHRFFLRTTPAARVCVCVCVYETEDWSCAQRFMENTCVCVCVYLICWCVGKCSRMRDKWSRAVLCAYIAWWFDQMVSECGQNVRWVAMLMLVHSSHI